ncbi:MAG TPA: ABC transporter ATP-binding protein [Gemmatimonadales bacterium]|nr:ABC transporter ATP-binding protein [Gemmatimonadales bacterium]HRZ09346.1 ABC transporter ATP-binding protein [Gemmatimonadales bacterium]
MLTLTHVTKRFRGGVTAVNDLSLELGPGVVGLLGPNGAGKTTLMQLIATITRPTDGQITFQGVDVLREPEPLRRQLGYLPQDFGVYDNLTAHEFLSYFAGLKGVTSRSRVDELLDLVNLRDVARRPAATFSGGMRQRLGIAQALLNDPVLLIVDEPTAGLDPEERVRFRHLLSDLGHARLVLLSTHIVSDIESLAGTIAVMREGRLLTCGAPEALLQSARGQVWEAVVPSAEYEQARARLKVTRAVRQADGVHARVVSRDRPFPAASPVEPDLEDAYVHLMHAGA